MLGDAEQSRVLAQQFSKQSSASGSSVNSNQLHNSRELGPQSLLQLQQSAGSNNSGLGIGQSISPGPQMGLVPSSSSLSGSNSVSTTTS